MIRGVNLLPVHRRHARLRHRHLKRWCAGYALYAGVIMGTWLISHGLAAGPEQAMADNISGVERQLAEAQVAIHEIQPRLAHARQMLAANRSVSGQPNWSLLLDLLAELLDDQTVLRSCELTPMLTINGVGGGSQVRATDVRTYRLHVTGLGQSQSSVSAYVLRLEQTGLFDHVKLLHTQAEPFRDQRMVGFQIECLLGMPEGKLR